jgi:hypothetical protein
VTAHAEIGVDVAPEIGVIRLRAHAESSPNGERREDPAPHIIAILRARRRSHA